MTEKSQNMFIEETSLIMLPPDARIISREQVATLVQLFGDDSAAAKALAWADNHNGPTRFWFSPSLGMLNVEPLPPDKATYSEN